MGAVFYEEMVDTTGEEYQAVQRQAGAVTANFGSGLMHGKRMFPEHIPASNNALIYYPYKNARALLAELAGQRANDGNDDIVVDYVNPVSGGPTFPTMGLSMRLINARSEVAAMHRTENIVFVTMEGSVTFSLPDNKKITTQPFDVTAIPSWVPYSMSNDSAEPAILFSQSDRPVFKALGFYREKAA